MAYAGLIHDVRLDAHPVAEPQGPVQRGRSSKGNYVYCITLSGPGFSQSCGSGGAGFSHSCGSGGAGFFQSWALEVLVSLSPVALEALASLSHVALEVLVSLSPVHWLLVALASLSPVVDGCSSGNTQQLPTPGRLETLSCFTCYYLVTGSCWGSCW